MTSNQHFVHWYADRTYGPLPEVTVWNAPIWLYKGLMVLWALWLAISLFQWLRWCWTALRKDGAPSASRRRRGLRAKAVEDPSTEGSARRASSKRARVS